MKNFTSITRLIRPWFHGLAIYAVFICSMLIKTRIFDHDLDINKAYSPWRSGMYWIDLGCLIILTCWIVLLPVLRRYWVCLVVNILLSTLLLADLVYFRYFKDFITVPVLLQFSQVSSLGGSIAELLRTNDILLFVDLPVWFAWTLWYTLTKRKRKPDRLAPAAQPTPIPAETDDVARPRPRSRWVRSAAAVLCLLILGSMFVYFPFEKARTAAATRSLFMANWWNISLYNATGIFGFHGYDMYRNAKQYLAGQQGLSADELAEVTAWFAENRQQLGQPAAWTGKYAGYNVVVVQAEAFQNFMLGQALNGVEVTPRLNALIQQEQTVYFSNYYHQTGQGRTSDADFVSHCSLYPLPTGSVYMRFPLNTYDCLPYVLQQQGYATAAFHAYDSSFWNRYQAYPQIGFEHFYSVKDYNIDEQIGWSLSDTSFFRQTVAKLQQMPQPFYAFLTTLSSHHPYAMPDKYKTLDTGKFDGTTFGDYLQAVHYVDEAVGSLIADLQQAGLWDRTLFVFYGDHDNSIDDPDSLSDFLQHPLTTLEFAKIHNQVPLIIHLPIDRADTTIPADFSQPAEATQLLGTTKPAGQIDLAPTLMDLLGIDLSDKHFMGSRLFDDQTSRLIAFRNGSFTDGNVFYIAPSDPLLQNGECYDEANGQPIDVSACQQGLEASRRQLKVSDRIILHNLLAK